MLNVPSVEGIKNVQKWKHKSNNAIIGKKDGSSSNLSVCKGKFASVFVTRFAPDTSAEDVKSYVESNLKVKVKCEKLNTKYDTDTSFKVEGNMQNPGDLMNPEAWPEGILIRRFYQKPVRNNPVVLHPQLINE